MATEQGHALAVGQLVTVLLLVVALVLTTLVATLTVLVAALTVLVATLVLLLVLLLMVVHASQERVREGLHRIVHGRDHRVLVVVLFLVHRLSEASQVLLVPVLVLLPAGLARHTGLLVGLADLFVGLRHMLD